MTVGELETRMTSREFQEWKSYFSILASERSDTSMDLGDLE